MMLIKASISGAKRKGNVSSTPITSSFSQPSCSLIACFFQFSHGMQNFPPFSNNIFPAGEFSAVTATIKQLNIKVAFQLVNGVTQSGRRLCRVWPTPPQNCLLFLRHRGSSTHPAVVSYTPLAVHAASCWRDRLLQRHYQRIGILVFKSQFITNPTAINNLTFAAVQTISELRRFQPQ